MSGQSEPTAGTIRGHSRQGEDVGIRRETEEIVTTRDRTKIISSFVRRVGNPRSPSS